MMLDAGGNEVPALITQEPGRAEDGQIIAFRAATGEDDFAGFASPNLGHPVAGIVQGGSRLASDLMDAGRVAKDTA